jgi:hypothetical protein
VDPAGSLPASHCPASLPPATLSVATTEDLKVHAGRSLSTSTTLMPRRCARSSAPTTFGLVGVTAIASTLCAIMLSMIAIWPSSSVPFLLCPKMT